MTNKSKGQGSIYIEYPGKQHMISDKLRLIEIKSIRFMGNDLSLFFYCPH